MELTEPGEAAASRAASAIHTLDRRIRRHVSAGDLRGFVAVVAAIGKESP